MTQQTQRLLLGAVLGIALFAGLWFAYGYHRYEKYGNNLILDTRTGKLYALDGQQVGAEPK